MLVKRPVGGLVTLVRSLMPQHSSSPFSRSAQVKPAPALMAVKRPLGGLASPWSLRPQHTASPFPRSAQAWSYPVVKDVKDAEPDAVVGVAVGVWVGV